MMTSYDLEIQQLVTDINDGTLLVPMFQREYRWEGWRIRDLFASLYSGSLSGQLLVARTDGSPHARTASLGGLTPNQDRPVLLLDGQQRLTSIASVLLAKPLEGCWPVRPIDIVFNVYTEKFEVAWSTLQTDAGWISLSRYFSNPTNTYDELKLHLPTAELGQVSQRLSRLDDIRRYKYCVSVLSELDIEEAQRYFVPEKAERAKPATADPTHTNPASLSSTEPRSIKGRGGRPTDELYDKIFARMQADNLSRDQAFQLYLGWKEQDTGKLCQNERTLLKRTFMKTMHRREQAQKRREN